MRHNYLLVTFNTDDHVQREQRIHARLQALKRRFDPGNLFRMNLNIAPAAASSSAMTGWSSPSDT